jgi:hypothetical protein
MHAWKPLAGSFLLVVSNTLIPATAAATGNPWFDKYTAYETANGNAYTSNPDAAFLAWQEGLLLRSYLNLYAATKNTAWLTKFTSHVTTMRTLQNNLGGDAYPDWTTGRYSPNIVLNGTFKEAGSTPATPPGWTPTSTTTTGERTTASGEYFSFCNGDIGGFKLATDGVAQQRVYQSLSYEPGWKYQLSIYGRNAASNTAHGRVFVYDHTDGDLLASLEINSTEWKNYSVDFFMPAAADHVVRVWLAHFSDTPANSTSFFDSIRVGRHYAYHVLDGMIGIPLANFVRLVHRTPSLQSAFGSFADDYQEFLEDDIIAKWHDAGAFYGNTWVDVSSTEGYYEEPAFDTFDANADFSPLPHNQYFALLEVQNILYDVNANATYLARAEQGARFFANLLENPGGSFAYSWHYGTHANAKVEDTSHSNVDMEFITEMHRSGSVFNDGHMDRFAATLTDHLWNCDLDTPKLHNHVDGSTGSYCNEHQFTTVMYGWIPYAQFDPFAWTLAAKQFAEMPAIYGHTAAATLSQIILWDPVKLVNQGFELPASGAPTLPARWSRLMSSPATAFRDSANKSTGEWGLTLISNGTSWQKLTQPWTGFVGGVSYTVTFDGKVDTSGANGRVWIYNVDTGTTIASHNFSSTTWQTHSFSFTSPAANTAVQIQLGHQDYTVNGGHTHFDNVVIKRTGDLW